jgi:hypothetical protein
MKKMINSNKLRRFIRGLVKAMGIAAFVVCCVLASSNWHPLWVYVGFGMLVFMWTVSNSNDAKLNSEGRQDLGALKTVVEFEIRCKDLQDKALALYHGLLDAREDYQKQHPESRPRCFSKNDAFTEAMNINLHFYYLLQFFTDLIQKYIMKDEFPAFNEWGDYFEYFKYD